MIQAPKNYWIVRGPKGFDVDSLAESEEYAIKIFLEGYNGCSKWIDALARGFECVKVRLVVLG